MTVVVNNAHGAKLRYVFTPKNGGVLRRTVLDITYLGKLEPQSTTHHASVHHALIQQ